MDAVLSGIGYVVVSILAILFLFKIALDFSFPYALMRAETRRGVSWFWLVELVPLTLGVFVAWLAGLEGWFSPTFLGVAGICFIGASLLHLVLASMIYGFVLSRRQESDSERQS